MAAVKAEKVFKRERRKIKRSRAFYQRCISCDLVNLMNQGNEKEIDLLLRRHARRGAEAFGGSHAMRGDGGAENAVAHLDADELSAYAENALPPSARARYSAHLAECEECRKIVTRLALSANAPLKEDGKVGVKTGERRSWSDWLAALFASPVLRFGTLALLLLGIAGAALIMMQQRKQEEHSLVAQNTRPGSATEEEPSLNHANTSGGEAASTGTTESSSANTSATSTRTANASLPQSTPAKLSDDARQPSSEENAKAQSQTQVGGIAGTASGTLNGQREAEVARTENQPQPPTPQGSYSAGATANTNEADELRARSAEEAQRQENERASERNNRAATTGAATTLSAQAPATEPQDRAQSGASARARRRGGSEDSETNSAATKNSVTLSETRRVAGHQFRRQGSVWVDTAYSSSMSTTSLSRGSDRYRALVADAPEIRTIAEQLGGEIIVVWNGRAYKIK
ncbi:MAG: hypothetical protein AUG51_07510 [Acidobacteria bacterium 13_1_20CM_3_53_8]|nr:MAG: hypothetical protein AUG51_07510 [Acidobacteria bacterium 13_1_20CM_3_53_8]